MRPKRRDAVWENGPFSILTPAVSKEANRETRRMQPSTCQCDGSSRKASKQHMMAAGLLQYNTCAAHHLIPTHKRRQRSRACKATKGWQRYSAVDIRCRETGSADCFPQCHQTCPSRQPSALWAFSSLDCLRSPCAV